MRYLWKFYDHEPETVEKLSRQLGVSLLTAKCLFNRGYRTSKEAEEFLNPFLRNLSDPFLIPDIEIAVERLIRAKDKGEAITIFGDYDVDGITATAILSDFFCTLGWNYQGSYLPLRMEEGYGLSDDGVRHCLRKYPKTQLLLAVDCGSTSSLAINQIQKSGVEVIVLDHHQIDPHDTPTPKALVNPRNLPPGEQPSDKLLDLQNLCSAGLAFKLAHAILKYARQKGHSWGNSFDLKSILDLVAMGTIADLVKLQGENRILVSHGLNRITNTQRTGLRELVRISQRKTISVHDVSFYLAPRLNAAGRLEDAQIALKLLTTTNPETGAHLAKQLDSVNLERKGIQNRIVEEVVERVKRNFNPEKDFIIVEENFEWHLGIIGIAAAQVVKLFRRPVIILGGNGQNWRGSCRSIEGFDMAAALCQCEELLLNHGGHSMAAGVEVELNKLEPFRTKINKVAREWLENKVFKPTLQIEAEIHLKDILPENFIELQRLSPFGMGNPLLIFSARNVHQVRPSRKFGQLQRHLKLFLSDSPGIVFESVIWNFEEEIPLNARFDIAFEPTLDCFNGQNIVRLRLVDWNIYL